MLKGRVMYCVTRLGCYVSDISPRNTYIRHIRDLREFRLVRVKLHQNRDRRDCDSEQWSWVYDYIKVYIKEGGAGLH